MASQIKTTFALLVSILFIVYIGTASASTVNFQLTGNVTYTDAGNLFGLTAPTTISATGSYDSSDLDGSGTGSIDFLTVPPQSLTITVGSIVFTEADDDDAIMEMSITTNNFNFLNYGGTVTTVDGDQLFTSLPANNFIGTDSSGGSILGTWDTSSFQTAVPIPAAVWLFGSGLLGLAGIARKKKKT